MDKQVGTVQNTIRDLGTRTRAINRTLRDVSLDGVDAALPLGSQGAFDGLLPMLAAGENEPAAED
jgi:DNA recombination protein RmuC